MSKGGHIKAPVNNYVSHVLRDIRLKKGISSDEAARRAGMHLGSFSCLENGFDKISLDNLFRMLGAVRAEVQDVWPNLAAPAPLDHDTVAVLLENALESRRKNSVTVSAVVDAVAEVFGLSRRELLEGSRERRLTEPKAACALLVREIGGLTMSQLEGIVKGGLSHSVRSRRKRGRAFDKRIDRARRLLRRRFPESFPECSRGEAR